MIKMLIMDVDGTLTDGKIYISSNGEEMKAFSVKDGYAIKNILHNLNIIPVIITGKISAIVERRAADLGITEVFQGVDDKKAVCEKLLIKYGFSYEEIAFIGDDYNDLELMKLCGFKACPCDAVDEIVNISDYQTSRSGGNGAVGELITLLSHK